MSSKLVRFLGSIRLAVPLLVAIAIILIAATIYESNVGSTTVQRLVYKSPWFGALMFLLAINLGLSTMSRYPWRGARKIGFAITHWGLIVLIAGSAAVIHLSTEGMVLVRTDGGPNNEVRVEGDVLEVVAPDQHRQQTDIFIRSDGSVYPSQFAGLTLQGYSESTMQTVRFADGGSVDNPAVQLELKSDRMGQILERWLAVAPASYSTVDMGPAHLEIAQANTDKELGQLLSAPDTRMGAAGTLRIGRKVLDVQAQMGQSVRLSDGIVATLTNVWSDFRLDGDGQPTSASEQFRNPAIQLTVTQGDIEERWFVFSQPGFDPIRSGEAIALNTPITYDAPLSNGNYFRVVVAPGHQLFYAALSSKGFTSGALHPGDVISPGWADIQISLVAQLDRAQLQRETVPVTPVADGTVASEGNPALQITDETGAISWLPWGTPTSIETPQGSYFAAFSPKLLQLPFYIKLNDFIVERNEGSESVAMWTSKVTLFDPERDTAVQRSVWMNHPTWFRGWKLAQASWNPGDLQQSTLQLKREPWWVTALTWLGSIMVVSGIGVMFYGRAIAKQLKSITPSVPEAENEAEPEGGSLREGEGAIAPTT